ncbi:sarcotoxin II-1-like [Anoplophora glabripennis]|uniref:sarcotoxin II-1-like n=1 Tax=Anoplophora glabripennis TaxID=217634 RepID=UPI00087432BA|nr:sarcotoxin II-1-like [Anoplophora glabripennis]
MKFFVFFVAAVAVAVAVPIEVAEDEEGQQYYLVPVSREKRQATKWGVSNTGVGLSHSGTILNNDNHRLDGSAYAAKNFGSHGLRPDQVGGRLDYAHKPSGSGAFISADNARRYGTDVNAGAQYNFVHKNNLDVGVVGQYGRHFGGPFGTGRPQGYVGLTATGRF